MKSSQQTQASELEPTATPDAPAVEGLLEERSKIAGWLERLDATPAANPRAVERVRADYRQRLDDVMTRLAGHRDALLEQRRALAAALAEAEEADQAARDALDEAELRFRIGELHETDWAGNRETLERAAEAAASALRDARDEAARLEEVLDTIEGGIDTVPSPGPFDRAHAPDAAQTRGAGGSPDPSEGAEPTPAADAASPPADPPPDPAARDGGAADGSITIDGEGAAPEFLEELDRAIEASSDTRPRPGAKCPECGYTNDFDAWFCGVCGVDLA